MEEGKQKCRGFTLIEWLIVLMIVALLAFIAVPNILRTRMSVNERSMKTALRAFQSANEAYRAPQQPPAYAEGIADLVTPKKGPSFLDSSWNIQPKHGFNLFYRGGGKDHPDSYSLLAVPVAPNQTARNSYCIDQKGMLVSSMDGEAPIQGTPEGCVGGNVIVS
jgi:prepilin-type N-terminal cleavage/methylation domain-containing protein